MVLFQIKVDIIHLHLVLMPKPPSPFNTDERKKIIFEEQKEYDGIQEERRQNEEAKHRFELLNNNTQCNHTRKILHETDIPYGLAGTNGISVIIVHSETEYDNGSEYSSLLNEFLNKFSFDNIYQHTTKGDPENNEKIFKRFEHETDYEGYFKLINNYKNYYAMKDQLNGKYGIPNTYFDNDIKGNNFILVGGYYNQCHLNAFKALIYQFVKSFKEDEKGIDATITIHLPKEYITQYNGAFLGKTEKIGDGAQFPKYKNFLENLKSIYGINYVFEETQKKPLGDIAPIKICTWSKRNIGCMIDYLND